VAAEDWAELTRQPTTVHHPPSKTLKGKMEDRQRRQEKTDNTPLEFHTDA